MTTTEHPPVASAAEYAGPAARRSGTLRRLDASGVPALLARLIVGGMMIWLAIPKILDPVTFLKLIHEYDMVPEGWHVAMNAMVVILPWVELIGGTLLIAGAALRGVATLLLMMLILFTTVIVLRTVDLVQAGEPFFKVSFDCGCGSGEQIIWKKLLENAGLIVLCGWLMWTRSRRFCVSPA